MKIKFKDGYVVEVDDNYAADKSMAQIKQEAYRSYRAVKRYTRDKKELSPEEAEIERRKEAHANVKGTKYKKNFQPPVTIPVNKYAEYKEERPTTGINRFNALEGNSLFNICASGNISDIYSAINGIVEDITADVEALEGKKMFLSEEDRRYWYQYYASSLEILEDYAKDENPEIRKACELGYKAIEENLKILEARDFAPGVKRDYYNDSKRASRIRRARRTRDMGRSAPYISLNQTRNTELFPIQKIEEDMKAIKREFVASLAETSSTEPGAIAEDAIAYIDSGYETNNVEDLVTKLESSVEKLYTMADEVSAYPDDDASTADKCDGIVTLIGRNVMHATTTEKYNGSIRDTLWSLIENAQNIASEHDFSANDIQAAWKQVKTHYFGDAWSELAKAAQTVIDLCGKKVGSSYNLTIPTTIGTSGGDFSGTKAASKGLVQQNVAKMNERGFASVSRKAVEMERATGNSYDRPATAAFREAAKNYRRRNRK